MIKKNFWHKGESLIEVLVAVVLIGLVLTAVASLMTSSLVRSSQAKYRELATVKGQEIIDVLRAERAKLGWAEFTTAYPNNTTFCYRGSIDQTTEGLCASSTEQIAGTDFKREFTITHESSGGQVQEVAISVEVSWYRNSVDPLQLWPSVQINHVLTNW